MMYLTFLTGLIQTAFLPATAHAAGIGGTIQQVGAGLVTSFTGLGYGDSAPGIAGKIVEVVWAMILPIGIFLVVRAGFSLVISQEEDKLSRAKRTIASTLLGIMLVYISQVLVKGFYGDTFNGATGGILNGGQGVLNTLVYGIVNWALVTVAALGTLIIILSVLRAISSFGKEEGVTNMRQTIFGVASGIIMISLLPAVKLTLGIVDLQPLGESGGATGNAAAIISTISVIVANLLVFLALLAVVIVIYAGIRMIVNLGNDDEYSKSKGLIFRALTGLFVILISYIVVSFVLSFAGGPTTP